MTERSKDQSNDQSKDQSNDRVPFSKTIHYGTSRCLAVLIIFIIAAGINPRGYVYRLEQESADHDIIRKLYLINISAIFCFVVSAYYNWKSDQPFSRTLFVTICNHGLYELY